MLPFKSGIGYLAACAQVPIVPVALSGTSELYLGRQITVAIGDVVALEDESPVPKVQAEAMVQRIRDSLEAMLTPYEEPAGVVKRWRWLTHIM